MAEGCNILISGVGGFGIGSVSRILSRAAEISGLDTIGSETHGLAQRGGVVTSTLRIGKALKGSPLIIHGNADILIALEALEALRSLSFVKRTGAIIYNTARYQPLSVRIGNAVYPDLASIKDELTKHCENVISVDAAEKAKSLGLSEAANVVMLGVLTRKQLLPFDLNTMREAVKSSTPTRFQDINLKALELEELVEV